MYDILKERDTITLVEEINKAIKKGYELQGGIATSNFNGNTYFYQAIYKKDS